MLEELLNDVVTKYVLHQLNRIRLDLPKHMFLFLAVGDRDFVLDETGSMLVPTKFDDVTAEVLKVMYQSLYNRI